MAKPIVLHLGDPVYYNKELYASLQEQFTIIRPDLAERQRPAFLEALRTKKWGDFAGIMRPFWNTGGEMGRWDAELVPLLPASLRVFASAGAGYDWADVDVLAAHGILYCNGASASSEAVADMALYHILSVFRNIQWSNMAARAGDADAFLDAHRNVPPGAHNPQGHVLGIVGFGNIGQRIGAKAARGLEMRIAYYDPFPKTAEQEAAGGNAVAYPSMAALLAAADCIVLAAPGSGGRLIDAAALASMKRGARLVNIARGGLVDSAAVADALESGQLAAVGLDVFDTEPNVEPRLVASRQATLTCHTAGGAHETNVGFERLSMENVRNVLTGQPALTPVNKHMMK